MKIIFTLILNLMFLGSNYSAQAQWVNLGRYQQIDTRTDNADKGYISKDGKNYYYSDKSSVFRVDIESGVIDTLVFSGEVSGIDQFVFSDDESVLYFTTDKSIFSYSIPAKKITAENKLFVTTFIDINFRNTLSMPHNLLIDNNNLICLSNFLDYAPKVQRYSGKMLKLSLDSLKLISSGSIEEAKNVYISNNNSIFIDSKFYEYYSAGMNRLEYLNYFKYIDLNAPAIKSVLYSKKIILEGVTVENMLIKEFLPPKGIAYLPNKELAIILGNNNFLYYYNPVDCLFLDSVYLGETVLFEPDFGETFVLFKDKDSSVKYLNLQNSRYYDSIVFSGSNIVNIKHLSQNHLFLVFDKNGKIFKTDFLLSSIPEIDNDRVCIQMVNVTPNPSSGTINVQFKTDQDADASILIYDVLGNKVMKLFDNHLYSGIQELDFDISALHPGFYYMQIFIGGKQYIRKIVKQ